MRLKTFCRNLTGLTCLLVCLSGSAAALELEAGSVFDTEQLKIRYNLASSDSFERSSFDLSRSFAADQPPASESGKGYKSPAKAFFLSLAVPGLGQYYYGSKIKPALFLGVEVASWALYFNWHNEGEDITAEFEAFNRAHWSRDRYEQEYLFYVYGVTDDEDVPPGTTEISHHLPDTRTQQYYEMTGKYDQFAWGWDDAVLNGETLGPSVQAITGPATTPSSARRAFYETRRNDANNAFDRATRMIFVSMANRLISAFEAMFTTRAINKKIRRENSEFGNFRVSAKLKSYYTKRDTPYISLTYKF